MNSYFDPGWGNADFRFSHFSNATVPISSVIFIFLSQLHSPPAVILAVQALARCRDP